MTKLISGWWRSRTIWFNVLVGLFAVLEAYTRFLQPLLGDTLYGITLLIVAAVNVFLRTITTQPLSEKGREPDNT